MPHRLRFFAIASLLGGLSLACSSSTDVAGSGGGSATTTTTTSAGGNAGTGSGTACTTTDGCGDTEYCDFPDDMCGAGQPGVCTPRPDACSDGSHIICGCDGKIRYAGCQTLQGFDTNADASACPITGPVGVGETVFACGDRFCRTSVSYCQRQVSDIANEPDSYACELFPQGCTDSDCACLADEPCGAMCAEPADGEVTLTCPGG